MRTTLVDLFKIEIGPSSSHAVVPMRGAFCFVRGLHPDVVGRIRIELNGSLALTGRGRGTPRGVLIGLAGEQPDTVAPATIDRRVTEIMERARLPMGGSYDIPFEFELDFLFHPDAVLPGHSNGRRFTTRSPKGELLENRVYYSIGGGFVVEEGENECAWRSEVEHAAVIGMEHNLTRGPIGGLVQISCIERNAFGAVKAVNAARMALEETGGHKVSLDQCNRTRKRLRWEGSR